MGWFSTKTTTHVSSSVYNLAGDESRRPKVLRSVLLGHILHDSEESFSSVLSRSLLNGVGIQQRRFFRWAQGSYDLGLPQARIGGASPVDLGAIQTAVEGYVGLPAGATLELFSAEIDYPNIAYWAEAWVMLTYPSAVPGDWSVEWIPFSSTIRVDVSTLDPLNPTHDIPAPADYLWAISGGVTNRKLLYLSYQITGPGPGFVVDPVAFATYRMGSGNTVFDALTSASSTALGEFFPALPLRLNNVSLSDPSHSTIYPNVKTAFKKLTSGSIDKLLESLEDNPDIGDIDYCFLVPGVPLNTQNQVALAYLRNFFQQMAAIQVTPRIVLDVYLDFRKKVLQDNGSYTSWRAAKLIELDGASGLTTASEIDAVVATPPPVSEFQLVSEDLPSFNNVIEWITIGESSFFGNAKSYDGDTSRGELSKGSYWFTAGPDTVLPTLTRDPSDSTSWSNAIYPGATLERVFLFYQQGTNSYSQIELIGLSHRNFVYGGVAVYTSAKDALATLDEDSPFLLPLHYPTVNNFGLIRATELASSNVYLIFNCYVQVKQKWWQSGFFKIILIIASVVVSVLLPPAGAGLLGGGILGSNLAIGAALGFSSATAAAIAGAVANSIAALIVTTLIQKASVKLFGDKWGQLIGSIVAVISMTYAKAYMNTGSFRVDWGAMFQADNLTGMTNSISGAYTAWSQGYVSSIRDEMQDLYSSYEEQNRAIQEKLDAFFDESGQVLDPFALLDAGDDNVFGIEDEVWESPGAFLQRTLMTGDDIAEVSQRMIENFAEDTLELSSLDETE